MRLTPVQEALLLRKHLTGDFGGVHNFESIKILLSRKLLEQEGKNLVVTTKGREYCDRHHLEINLSSIGMSLLNTPESPQARAHTNGFRAK